MVLPKSSEARHDVSKSGQIENWDQLSVAWSLRSRGHQADSPDLQDSWNLPAGLPDHTSTRTHRWPFGSPSAQLYPSSSLYG
ncbi:hypothetical protein RRG08_020241 [Elysia crispata]|uniref:Uncharacterized protein n=1 Tax=Elysia crispata TaxID=231223 RepID=A0AAE1DR12_9GAST|nr:hypothetical protein RRG08_020241 [Elysia crispata]